jgi:receptor protein-tyrosine kinase
MGDGKTTVACNLSIAVAEIGRKVLLIDGDLRRPRLHKVFGMANTWGLSDQLWADFPLDSVSISDLVRQTEVSGLSVLPGGSCGVTPTNLFYSPRMSKLLTRLRREFDMVLIDAPPMIHLADARVLGRLSDGVILVVRAGQTTTESARFAIQRFAEDGTCVLGTVLNSWDPRTAGSYSYGNYGAYKDYSSSRPAK